MTWQPPITGYPLLWSIFAAATGLVAVPLLWLGWWRLAIRGGRLGRGDGGDRLALLQEARGVTARRKRPLGTWGDPELDRLWRAMYEAEMAMDDMDIATMSPAYHRAMAATEAFRAECARQDERAEHKRLEGRRRFR